MRNIILAAILTSLAIVLSIMERFFPIAFLIPIPGFKIGIANIVTMFAIIKMDFRSALLILIARILLVTLLIGSVSSFLFSLLGGLFSIFIMKLLLKYKDKYFSIIGISIAGAAFHNIGQIIAAIIILKTFDVIAYLGLLLIVSIIVGVIIGIIVTFLIEKLDKI